MKLSGPQSERNSIWSGKLDSQRRDVTHGRGGEDVRVDSELSRLRGENKSLRDQLQRSLKELKAFQVKFPSAHIENLDGEHSDWTTAPEVISPLLAAYDARIDELEQTISQQNVKLEGMKESIEVLIRENEELRETHLDKIRGGNPKDRNRALTPSTPLSSELFAEMNERIDILMDENSLLVEQKVVLGTELDKVQGFLNKKQQEIESLSETLTQLSGDLGFTTKSLHQAETDRDEAAKQALTCSDSLGKLELDLEIANERLSATNHRGKELETTVAELRKQLKSYSDRSENDNLTTLRRVKLAEDRVREVQSLLARKTQELDTTVEINRKLRTEYQNTRQDAEGMLQVMSGLGRQLNEYSLREEEVERLAKESKDKIEESLAIKEQSVVKEDQNRKEVGRLLSERKTISLQRKDELERAADQMRKVLSEQSASFEKEMTEMAEKNGRLIFEAEKVTRDNKSTQEMFGSMQRLHEEELRKTTQIVRDLTEKLQALIIVKEDEQAKRMDMQEQNKDLRLTIDKVRSQLDSLRIDQLQLERKAESESADMKIALRDAQKDATEKQRLLTRKTKELDDLRASMLNQMSSLERKYQDETGQYKRRAAEADRFSKDLEAAGYAGDVRTQALVDQLKEKYLSAVTQLESKLRVEVEQIKNLTIKNRNSELIISDLLSEKAYTTRVVEEAKDTIHQQEEEILSCRATINDITGQLSASYSAREEGAIRAARTIEELNLTSSKLSKYPYVACDTSELGNNFELETAYKHIVSSYVSTNPITLVSDHSAAEQKTERYTDT